MKFLFSFLMLAIMTAFTAPAFAGGGGGVGQKFVKEIYVKYGGATTNQGSSYDAAKSCAADGDLWAIPAGIVIEKAYLVIDTAITGSSALDFGDDDDPNGFFDGGVSGAEGASLVAGMYGWSPKLAGAYMRVETAGATDPADIDVVGSAKYYSATGKEVKLDITTACTAGRFRVVLEGYYLGAK